MYLIIDTSADAQFTVALAKSDGCLLYQKKINAQLKQSEKLLPAIDNILKQKKMLPNALSGIIVVLGPGGFTSMRIGVITANTLAYALDIPAVGLKLTEFKGINNLAKKGSNKLKSAQAGNILVPYYGSEPNITKAKKSIWQ